ncbi:MAG: hypothetical protein JWO69_298 [Thermoleophilia bacterium]|nr:hypothetical protein [Thermoleophilia bacterium]
MTVIILFVLLVAAGCGGGDGVEPTTPTGEPAPTPTVAEAEIEEGDVGTSFDLLEMEGSGVTGTVRVASTDDAKLKVQVELPGDTAVRAVASAMGGCSDAGDEGGLTGAATTFELPDTEAGASQATVDPPDELVSEGTYSIIVYESDSPDSTPVACAEVAVA